MKRRVVSSPSLAAVSDTMKLSTMCKGGVVAESLANLASFFGSSWAAPGTLATPRGDRQLMNMPSPAALSIAFTQYPDILRAICSMVQGSSERQKPCLCVSGRGYEPLTHPAPCSGASTSRPPEGSRHPQYCLIGAADPRTS